MNEPVRLDKWLWAVRIFKTRGLATDACRAGKVTVAGQPAKASRDVKIGDVIAADNGTLTRTMKVLSHLSKRVGAAEIAAFAEDLTPASEYNKPREPYLRPLFARPKGAGRPTKKERRDMDGFNF